jgi:hypothetical protein
MSKKLINGLKYEKQTEEQLYDLSQWELVDIILAYREDLKAKEQECERLKEEIKKHNDDMFKNPPEKRFYCNGCTLPYISKKQSQTLTEIKEVLQFYNNTTIGVDKGNGIFEFEVSNDNVGKFIYCYDTNPAKRALQKISEVLE